MMDTWCGIYDLFLPHQLTRRDITWKLCSIHEPIHLTMELNHCSFAENYEFSLRTDAPNFIHKLKEFVVNKVLRMFESAMWRRDPNLCRCYARELQELKENLGEQRCELETQRAKIAHLETKLEEQTQKHDKETCIILRAMNK